MIARVPTCRALGGVFALTALLGLAGCSKDKTYPVRGKFVYPDGSPMKGGGAVMFEPTVIDKNSVGARGNIDTETGQFVLGTFAPMDGAPPGRYRVQIRPRIMRPARGHEDDGGANTAGDPLAVHPRFRDVATSPLEYTVEPKTNEFVITIERAPPPGK